MVWWKGFNSYWVLKKLIRGSEWNFTFPILHPWKQLLTNVYTAKKLIMWIKTDCEVRDIFVWQERSYKSLVKCWIFDCNSIHSMWKFTVNVFMLTENGVASIQKYWLFGGNLETYSQIPLSKWKARLNVLLFTGVC